MANTIKVQVVFGSDAVSALVDEATVTADVLAGFEEYEFASQAEADAFMAGVDTACGWIAYHQPDADELCLIRHAQEKAESPAKAE